MERDDIWLASEREVARLGVPVKYKGYYYLIVAVVLQLKIGVRKASLSKEIYEAIADMQDVSSQSVEKAIRISIVKAWTDENGTLRCTYPGYSTKPSNSEVIAYITSRIRLETPPGI